MHNDINMLARRAGFSLPTLMATTRVAAPSMVRRRRYWLVKSEPGVYSIEDLERDGETAWDGVRNYEARNTMRDDMHVGDGVLFYHSNADPVGVAGMAEVSREAYPDHTQFDPESPYHDPKSDPDSPRWVMVDLRFVHRFDQVVPLSEVKADPRFAGMPLVQKGQRLSVLPVERKHFELIVRMGRPGA